MASEENIQVAVKVRPCSDHIGKSSSCLQCDPASGTIDIVTHGREKRFDFNAIFGEAATQVKSYIEWHSYMEIKF